MNPTHNTEPSVLVESSNIDLTASTKAFWELLGPIQWAMNYSGSVSLAPRRVSGLPAGTRAADIDSLLIRGEREELQMLWIISRCPHRRTENWTRDTQRSTGHWTHLCFSIDSGSRYSRIDIWGAIPCMMWRKNSSETFVFNFTMVLCSQYGVVSVKMKPQKFSLILYCIAMHSESNNNNKK